LAHFWRYFLTKLFSFWKKKFSAFLFRISGKRWIGGNV